MKHLSYITALFILLSTFAAGAATPEQMEQGRAIAYKYCLRNMDNGSGYLDQLPKPKTVAELEAKLKGVEKENIQKLKSISIPNESEYASWDKAKFLNYWNNTFVKEANAKSKFASSVGYARSKMLPALEGITVTVQETPKAEEPKAEEPKAEETAEQTQQQEEVKESKTIEPTKPAETEEVKTPAAPEPTKKKSDNTASIIVLCVLVVVVVLLVGYALNIMKKNRNRTSDKPRSRRTDYEEEDEEEDDDNEEEPIEDPRRQPVRRQPRTQTTTISDRYISRRQQEEQSRYASEGRQSFSTVLNDPEDESPFAAYSNFEPEPEPIPDSRDREIARLKAEIAALQSQNGRRVDADMPRHTPSYHRRTRIIYLTEANIEGIFKGAAAKYISGRSIFKLVTTDGVSGSFSVIEDPTVFDIALEMPRDFLASACIGHNLLNTRGANPIINEASGTAIFEDGRWKVIRKAQISYAG